MPGEGALIGIDLGTTAVKIVANGIDGREFAEATQRYSLATPQPGFVEQDPDEIYRATMQCLTRVLGEVRLRGELPLAIGFSSAMHGVLAVDDRGEPISPYSLTKYWHDVRRTAGLPTLRFHDLRHTATTSRTRSPPPPVPALPHSARSVCGIARAASAMMNASLASVLASPG